ncbi:MAG: hypothetical protein GTN40_00410, partial [Candidatus Aenigmarchaeota archaeon]|nr:hypothetical protein [Candidatus Aenigmarchaeota archaeon]
MPKRLTPLVSGEIYHAFNQSIDHHPLFVGKRECQRAIDCTKFYQLLVPMKFSSFLVMSKEKRESIIRQKNIKKLVDLSAYCLMPNHFHFLLKQLADNGISKFMSNFQNSFTRYYNTKNERRGSIFVGQFKAVRIETEEQLLHISRYIHLNPYTSFVVKDLKNLKDYKWSSFPEYVTLNGAGVCNKEIILSLFKDGHSYLNFVFDQADYQRELNKIKHLFIEK